MRCSDAFSVYKVSDLMIKKAKIIAQKNRGSIFYHDVSTSILIK